MNVARQSRSSASSGAMDGFTAERCASATPAAASTAAPAFRGETAHRGDATARDEDGRAEAVVERRQEQADLERAQPLQLAQVGDRRLERGQPIA